MIGADEYYNLINKAFRLKVRELSKINCGGYGDGYKYENIVFLLSEHARGKTFSIWIYETDYIIDALKDNHIEVYGMTGGQRGWTETYGWTKDGLWKPYIERYFSDLHKIIEKREQEQEIIKQILGKMKLQEEQAEIDKFNMLFQTK